MSNDYVAFGGMIDGGNGFLVDPNGTTNDYAVQMGYSASVPTGPAPNITLSYFLTEPFTDVAAMTANASPLVSFAITEPFADVAAMTSVVTSDVTFVVTENSVVTGGSIYGATAYTGTENNDSGNGQELTLGAVVSAFAPVTITHVKFWKVSNDTATSRTVALYDYAGAMLASGTSSGEPVGVAQWVTVPLTVPFA